MLGLQLDFHYAVVYRYYWNMHKSHIFLSSNSKNNKQTNNKKPWCFDMNWTLEEGIGIHTKNIHVTNNEKPWGIQGTGEKQTRTGQVEEPLLFKAISFQYL